MNYPSVFIFPQWMRGILLVGGIFLGVRGIFVYNFNNSIVRWITDSYNTLNTFLPDFIGIVLLFTGLMLIPTAFYPVKFRVMILLSILVIIGEGLFLYFSVMDQMFTKKFILYLILNDILWFFLLGTILIKAQLSR
jgi:hypothetical protein